MIVSKILYYAITATSEVIEFLVYFFIQVYCGMILFVNRLTRIELFRALTSVNT